MISISTNLVRLSRIVVGATALIASTVVWADFPDRPITMVVNFGPGGVTDLMARALASGMEENLGQSVVVENRPGALGTIGPAHVARQKADGYTLAIVSASVITTTPHLMDVSVQPEDLIQVAGFGKNRYAIVVNTESESQTIDDLIDSAKKGESVFFGSPSTPNSLIFFDLGRKTGADFELISYKSGPDASLALLSGDVAAIAANPPDVLSHLRANKLRMLASGSEERWPEYSEIPTLKEAGYDVSVEAWASVAVPAGTPQEIVDQLERSIKSALDKNEVQEKIRQVGADPQFMSGMAYTEYLTEERKKIGDIIEDSDIPRIK